MADSAATPTRPPATSNIWIAASEGNLDHVKYFLDADESLLPTSPDPNTYTPIHAAASYGHLDLLRYLLTHPRSSKGDVDVPDEDGDTPLFTVEDVATAKLLIGEFGADAKRTNGEGVTPAANMFENGWDEVAEYVRGITGEADPRVQLAEQEGEGDGEAVEAGEEGKSATQDDLDEIIDIVAQELDDEKHDGIVTEKYVEMLSEYSSCEISDALIKLSHPTGGHLPNLSLYSPSPSHLSPTQLASHKICGQVFPVSMISTSHPSSTAPPKPSTHFVDAAPRGSVMLLQAPSRTESAVWGGLMTAGAQSRGVKAVVIDGKCRDLKEHWDAQFPVFARGHSTLGQSPFTRVGTMGQSLTFPYEDENAASTSTSTSTPSSPTPNPPFPSQTVHPTDLLLADLDGVVVIPRNRVRSVCEVAQRGKEVDEKCMAELKGGKGVKETFERWRGKG